ncbi:helix-turn-helix transcriptional regulator [Rhodococcus sp. NPDC059968]|uniref:helix-turn-helix transcriptional regulator n=1 Tax=Rhodococcus sp. NPDC059968 TaxID=3347017 RepID=UPI0036713212
MSPSKDNDLRRRIRDFMVSRRERVTPGDLGIQGNDPKRRVKGLRREEVAMLAGVSVEYYTRLERGDAAGASASIINSVARVLRLTDVEREHLRRLHQALAEGDAAEPIRMVTQVRPDVQRLLDAMEHIPAFAVNRRGDVIAANLLGRAFYAPMYDGSRDPVNHTWFHFNNQPASRAFWVDWDIIADNSVDILRTELGTGRDDPELSALVAELLEVEEFATRWASHNVRRHATGLKRVNHPVVGRMDLTYEGMYLAAHVDVSLLTFNPEPGTPAGDAMRLLDLWARDDARFDQDAPGTRQ